MASANIHVFLEYQFTSTVFIPSQQTQNTTFKFPHLSEKIVKQLKHSKRDREDYDISREAENAVEGTGCLKEESNIKAAFALYVTNPHEYEVLGHVTRSHPNNMASTQSFCKIDLTPDDIPGANLDPNGFIKYGNVSLKRWLECRDLKITSNRSDLIQRRVKTMSVQICQSSYPVVSIHH